MLNKNIRKLYVFLILISFVATFTACGLTGDRDLNQIPKVTITSYTGYDEEVDANETTAPYEQTIYWKGEDVDGIVVGYAYRILNENGEPISTPGNYFIDNDGSFSPPELGKGWVLHYLKGANEDLPLDHPASKKTVWTEKLYATINFPGSNSNGEVAVVPCSFEIVAIDDRGGISRSAIKYFNTTSGQPEIFFSSSRGQLQKENSNGSITPYKVGQGIRMVFTMSSMEKDVVPGSIIKLKPWYYEYRVYHVECSNNQINPTAALITTEEYKEYDDPEYGWYSTLDLKNQDEVVLTSSTTPSLKSNYTPENPNATVPPTVTVFEGRGYDLAGVRSETKRVMFWVSDQYSPSTLIYPKFSYALGEYHYVLSPDTDNVDIHPSTIGLDGVRYASNLTANPIFAEGGDDKVIVDYEWAVVGDRSTRFWLRWGYNGEFENNDPNQPKFEKLADSLGVNYYSEVSYYHIQLNGERYNFEPIIQTVPQDSPDWLKVPVSHEIAQKVVFSNLEPGRRHIFKVKAEDLQGKIDPKESVLVINLIPPKPVAERSGVLYISNTRGQSMPNQPNFNDVRFGEPTNIRAFYDKVITGMNIDYLHRPTIATTLATSYKEYDTRSPKTSHLFPYSILQNYKYVFYACDSANQGITINDITNNFVSDINGLRIYLNNGGNMILIGNHTLAGAASALYQNEEYFLTRYFGFPPNDAPLTAKIFNNVNTRREYFLLGANGQSGFPSMNANITNLTEMFSAYKDNVIARQGLGSYSFFNDETALAGATPLYKFVCKEVGAGPIVIYNNVEYNCAPLDTPERNEYQGKVIGIRKSNGTGTAYTFGFPLTHMNENDVRALLGQILN